MKIQDVEMTSETKHITVQVAMNDEEERVISVFADVTNDTCNVIDTEIDNLEIDKMGCDQPKNKKEKEEIIRFVKNNLK